MPKLAAKAESKDIVKNWLRTKSTIEFLGIWEQINNPDFKGVEFDQFKLEAGSIALCYLHFNKAAYFRLAK